MASSHVVVGADAAQRRREARQRPSLPRRTPVERRRLEEALDAALSVVEAAVALLDVMDGETDLEPACEDEGAQCEDEGAGDDREPDQDGDGMVERSWQIGGRDVRMVDGADRSWAERQGSSGQVCHLIDPDDAPDPLQPSRLGFGCAR